MESINQPDSCHSERSEESSWTLDALKTLHKSDWILRCAQNGRSFSKLPASSVPSVFNIPSDRASA